VVTAPEAGAAGARSWRENARQLERLGYQTLLTPDNLMLPSPTVSLSVAASVTSTLRVGSYVMASPLRTPRAAAWEAHSLATLTEGRFELGLGTGIPVMRQQAEELGLPYGSGPERLDAVAQTITQLRALETDSRTPVLIAAGGPKARALAASHADIVTLADGALTSRDDVESHFREIRQLAGDRADDIELSMSLFVVNGEVPDEMRRFAGADTATLIAGESVNVLHGDTDAMVDELRRRRDRFGVSYIVVNGTFAEALAPVVEQLAGH
jgi:probable F420-dependent oxidoreductase